MAKRYEENVDYMDLINKAEASGDYGAAAEYEQLRNEKIADMGNTGYTPTNNYQHGDSGTSGSGNSHWTAPQSNNKISQSDKNNWLAEMEKNSNAWKTETDAAKKQQYHDANVALGGKLGMSYDANSGKWSGGYDAYDPQKYNGQYDSQYSDQLDQILNGILSKDKFEYNAENDPLYAQYAKQFQREGKRAISNTMGEVAANTGGLASSYATTAASQAGDYYASKQADKIPELEQLAYSKYLQDIDSQIQKLGLLQNADNTQYGRYRDTVGDARYESEFAYQKEQDRYNKQWANAQKLEQFGDFSGYGVMGYNPSQTAGMGSSWLEDTKKKNETYGQEKTIRDLEIAQAQARLNQTYNTNEAKKVNKSRARQPEKPKQVQKYGNPAQYVSNQTDTRRNGEDWINIPGLGRFSWDELEKEVASGYIKETYNPKTKKYEYTRA